MMIVGLDGVGMSVLIAAVAGDLGDVVAVDTFQEKLKLARELGATVIGTPEDVQIFGLRANHARECAGISEHLRLRSGVSSPAVVQ